MKVENFEDLHIYISTREVVKNIYSVTKSGKFSKDYSLCGQIRRAAVSILSNIAEGFDRGSNTEFVQYLFIAKGSCAEVIAQLTVSFDQEYIDNETFLKMRGEIKKTSAMITNLIKYLKESGLKGKKFSPVLP